MVPDANSLFHTRWGGQLCSLKICWIAPPPGCVCVCVCVCACVHSRFNKCVQPLFPIKCLKWKMPDPQLIVCVCACVCVCVCMCVEYFVMGIHALGVQGVQLFLRKETMDFIDMVLMEWIIKLCTQLCRVGQIRNYTISTFIYLFIYLVFNFFPPLPVTSVAIIYLYIKILIYIFYRPQNCFCNTTNRQ